MLELVKENKLFVKLVKKHKLHLSLIQYQKLKVCEEDVKKDISAILNYLKI